MFFLDLEHYDLSIVEKTHFSIMCQLVDTERWQMSKSEYVCVLGIFPDQHVTIRKSHRCWIIHTIFTSSEPGTPSTSPVSSGS